MIRHDINSTWISGPRRITVVQTPARPAAQLAIYQPTQLLILHDAQNLFEPDRAHRPGHHWQVAETVEGLAEEDVLPPLVVVGIDHAEEDRVVELTPSEDGHPGAGMSWRYGRFVMEELVPFLAEEYDIDVTPGAIGLGGSSLGGLATLALAHQYPGRFGRLLVMSPSLWWDNRVILRRLRRQPLLPSTRVWLDCGHQEGRDTLSNVRQLRRLFRDQLDLGNVGGAEDPDGDHSEDAWARRLPDALRWLYGRPG
jgi:predicted alpha/beta superfamily hydrolase